MHDESCKVCQLKPLAGRASPHSNRRSRHRRKVEPNSCPQNEAQRPHSIQTSCSLSSAPFDLVPSPSPSLALLVRALRQPCQRADQGARVKKNADQSHSARSFSGLSSREAAQDQSRLLPPRATEPRQTRSESRPFSRSQNGFKSGPWCTMRML